MEKLNQLVDVFRSFRMQPLPTDQFETMGKEVLMNKMRPFVEHNEPILFSMLGYPMKSPNHRDKVLGSMPDMGEEVSLKNFARFNHEIRKIHTPGARVTIISDGYIFNDLMEVTDGEVQEYGEINEDITKLMPIEWYTAKDFYPKRLSTNEIRDKVVSQFGISDEELERRILLDPDVKSLYLGMIKFMNLDIAIRDFPSKNQLQVAAKKLARAMMLRNEAYSAMIRQEFGDHIRLSMHPSINNGTKFSFQLIPSLNAHHSPWHSCLVVKQDGTMQTMHKKDAIEQGFEIVSKDGRPYYFTSQ